MNEEGADFKTSTEKNGEAAPHTPVRGRAQGSNTENAPPCKHLTIFHQEHYAVRYARQRRTSHTLNVRA